MSKCDLTIQLENSDRKYRGGETVRGTVTVQVNKDVRCNGLNVGFRWQTQGSGNNDGESESPTTLFTGEWRAGESLEYPFELVAPDGPLTYYGHHVSIAQIIYATVDIPWALDPKTEVDCILLPGDRAYSELLQKPTSETIEFKGTHPIGLAILTLLVVGAAAGWIFDSMIATGICGGLSLIIGFFVIRRLRRDARLGPIEGQVRPLSLAPGGEISFELKFTPKADLELNQLRIELRGEESATSGSGTNVTHYSHEVAKESIEISGPRTCPAEEPVVFSSTIPMIDTSAFSFAASDNKITWYFHIKLDIKDLVNWSTVRILRVRPGF